MGMVYELDETEKPQLLSVVVDRPRADLNDGNPLSQMKPRPGEKIQKFWCEGCEEWHEGSVLGGPVGDPHGEAIK